MRSDDLPSLGAFPRGHNMRRDMANIISQLEITANRGSDNRDTIKGVQAFLVSALQATKAIKVNKP